MNWLTRRTALAWQIFRSEGLLVLIQRMLTKLGGPPLKQSDGATLIDVIVPVYGQLEFTKVCINSVLRANQQVQFELIVIDDASPNLELRQWLDRLVTAGLITLHRHPTNLGFVASANLGMSLHPDRDVVLLNSDTEVHGDWLDRLQAASRSQNSVGTVTPWSNNATICSYPAWPTGSELPPNLRLETLDALVKSSFAHVTIPIPTAVGFCMYICRRCLDEVGQFDQTAFGYGYGEENDFCMRALQSGYTHLLAADAYVYHSGNASFGATSRALKERAATIIRDRWPDYDDLVRNFIAADPSSPLRRQLDLALRRMDARPS